MWEVGDTTFVPLAWEQRFDDARNAYYFNTTTKVSKSPGRVSSG